jgi:hypothetical protein
MMAAQDAPEAITRCVVIKAPWQMFVLKSPSIQPGLLKVLSTATQKSINWADPRPGFQIVALFARLHGSHKS